MICPTCGQFADDAPEPEREQKPDLPLAVYMARAHVAWARRYKPWLLKVEGLRH